MADALTRLLATRPWLLADGATGTNLFASGLASGDAPELWNVLHPDRVRALARSFVEAGADIILTNTFGGTRYRLQLHQAADRVRELNIAAVRIAREAASGADHEVIVAGNIGPTGEILEPVGPLSADAAQAAFAEQAAALAEGGADVLWIETLSSREELEAAIRGAATTGLPVIGTMSFDTNGRTMMALTPAELAGVQRAHGLLACGSNCGTGPPEVIASLVNLATAANSDAILVAKANCGIPRFENGAIRYDGTPDLMAAYACMAYDAGARIIGGCCGTTPEHLRAMHRALETHARGTKPGIELIEAAFGKLSSGARAQLNGQLDRAAGASPDAVPRRVSGRRRTGAAHRTAE
ncbi:MAG TPA: betaine--homocysteine S-methyltransferase [Steroidobacteraceae bacterium]